ncbi:MAG TPA: hypothetical protein VEU29_08580 [Actinomycetota bacterium]|nr:hypothetical protein [Actinomycetota bacterium]
MVGGIGGVLHGSPLPTSDVDVVPELNTPNLAALARALKELNAKVMSHDAPNGLIKVDWTAKDLRRWILDLRFLGLMTEHGRLDLIHRPGGTRGYGELALAAEDVQLDDVTVKVAALEDIIRSKEAVARQRDLEQLPTLRMLLEMKRERG